MANFQLTPGQVAAYNKDGYVIVPGFLTTAEVDKLYQIATEDEAVKKHAFDLNDQTGKKQNLPCGIHPAMTPTDCSPKAGGWWSR